MNDTQTLAATPMTDALALGPIASLPSSERWAEAVGLARQLERDLAAARADRAALIAALESVVAHYDMGGVDGPYANPDATAWCIDKARAALVQS